MSTSERTSRGWLLWLLLAPVLGAAFFGLGRSVAIAREAARSFGRAATFSTPRDPLEFEREIALTPTRPAVSLTREDAVALELIGRNQTLPSSEGLRTAQALCEEALRLGYDPLLFLAVIQVESNYNHLAVSPVGAEGLMQLMPHTAEWFSIAQGLAWDDRHSFDPVVNVRLGVRYLVMLHRQFHGRLDLALTAYNRGPDATKLLVQRNGGLPLDIREFYAGKVLEKYRALRAEYGHLAAS